MVQLPFADRDEAGRLLGAPSRRRSGVVQLLILFLNPLVLILLIAATASALLGERVDASIIIIVVVVGVAINFVQTYRSSRAAERLREHIWTRPDFARLS